MVEHLPPCGPNPALCERVRPWRSVGQPDDPHALAAEDLIEDGAELRVPIAEQELGYQLTVLEFPGQVPSLLNHPGAGRMVGAASQVNAPTPHLYKEEHVEPGQPHRVDAEEVDREEQVGVLADELPPGR